MSEGAEQNWIQRAWAGWCGFWFRPADPTPLAMMRIVAGLLTLYVHIAYCLDLKSFFGENGWYERSLAERPSANIRFSFRRRIPIDRSSGSRCRRQSICAKRFGNSRTISTPIPRVRKLST